MTIYRCNIRNSPVDGWEKCDASTAKEAAVAYAEGVAQEYQPATKIFVLAPGENPGVDEPEVYDLCPYCLGTGIVVFGDMEQSCSSCYEEREF